MPETLKSSETLRLRQSREDGKQRLPSLKNTLMKFTDPKGYLGVFLSV